MSRGGNTYHPLDELLETPLLRLLRGLSRFDWVCGRDLFDAIEVPQYTVDAEARNVYSVTLSRLVKRELAECRGPHASRDYRITPLGRRTLQDGFDAVQDAIDCEAAAKRRKRRGRKAKPRKWTAADQRAQYWARKEARRCVCCAAGLQEDDGTTCVECAERKRQNSKTPRARRRNLMASKRWLKSERGRQYAKELQRTRYWKHKQSGICVECCEPALDDNVRCQRHRDYQRECARNYERRTYVPKRAA
jgi:hypothetical protein